MYVYSALLSANYDSMFIFLVGLYLLAISTGETTIGLSLLILRISIFGSISTIDNFNFKGYYLGKRRSLSVINSRLKKNV